MYCFNRVNDSNQPEPLCPKGLFWVMRPGQTIDGDVTWLEVPSYTKYRWAYLDGHRVVVDAETHNVVAVY